MLRYSLCLLAGAFSLGLLTRLPSSTYLAALSAAALVCHVKAPLRLLGSFLLGLSLQWGATAYNISDRLSAELAGQVVTVRAVIADFPVKRGNLLSFVANIEENALLPRRVRLSWYDAVGTPDIGEFWSLQVRLRRPRGFANPAGFDYEAWLVRQGIGATGYVVASEHNRKLESPSVGLSVSLRRHAVERMLELLPDDAATAVLLAIGVGARHRISRQQWDQYAVTGTSHLMAISGLHVGLAAGGAFLLFWMVIATVARDANARDIAMWLAVLVAVVYAELSGLAVPARRAILMAVLAVIALSIRRRPDAVSVVALVCVLIAVSDPMSIHTPGFQLSFAAVALLLWLNQSYFRPPGKTGVSVLNVLCGAIHQLTVLQIVLLLGLLPLVATSFGRVAWLAPAVNLVVLPVFNFVTVPACLLGLLLDGLFSGPGDRLLQLAHASVGIVLRVVGTAADWRATRVELTALSWPMVTATVFIAGAAILPRGWPCRHVAWLLLLAVIQYRPQPPPAGCVDIHVLDVGQGLAVVLQTRGHTAVYDTGPSFRGGGDTGQLVVAPFLKSRGIGRIDALVVSHGDLDHAGGTMSLMREFDVPLVLAGEPLPLQGAAQKLCHAGQQWHWDGVKFEFVHPLAGQPRDGNDASCVLLVSSGSQQALLTGDIGARIENTLLERGIPQPIEVVTVPHHGSRTSSSNGFVTGVAAKIAVVSSGYNNRWGFPKEDVVRRWEAAGAKLLTTASSGAISQRLCRGAPPGKAREERIDGRRYWHD